MIYAWIEAEKATNQRLNVAAACRILGVSRQGFYAWRNSLHTESPRQIANQQLLEEIKAIHDEFPAYGSPRIRAVLCQRGQQVGVNPGGSSHERTRNPGSPRPAQSKTSISTPSASSRSSRPGATTILSRPAQPAVVCRHHPDPYPARMAICGGHHRRIQPEDHRLDYVETPYRQPRSPRPRPSRQKSTATSRRNRPL